MEAFPYDGNRYELLHGLLLVTPQPGLPHQVVASRLMLKLGLSFVNEPTVQLYARTSLPRLARGAGFPVVGQF